MALGSGSTTVPSSTIASSLGFGNLGLLVHGGADPVADVLPNDREPGPLGDGLDGVADVGEAVAVADLVDARQQALLGDLHQAAGLLADLPDGDGDGGVAVVPLD